MNYFESCRTLEEADSLKRKLSLHLHPDRGGNKEAFQEMMRQYDRFKSNYLKSFLNSDRTFKNRFKNAEINVTGDDVEIFVPGVLKGNFTILANTEKSYLTVFSTAFNIIKNLI